MRGVLTLFLRYAGTKDSYNYNLRFDVKMVIYATC